MLYKIQIEKDLLIIEISRFSLEDIHDIIEKVEESKVSKVLLEIQDSSVASSSTLALLAMVNRSLQKLNVKLGVVNINEEDRKMMKWSGLDKTFNIFDNIAHGIEDMTTNEIH